MINIPAIDNLVEIHNSNNTVVYEGFDVSTKKPVAVKVLKDEFPSLRSIAKFNEEYEITHNLDIQGVRRAYAKQKIQNRHILLLDYIEGTPLRAIIDEGRIKVKDFLPIAIKIASVLSEVHQQRIIHKDINPRNILMMPDEEVKIIDFGISTQIKKQTQQLESPDALEGTLAYISPEQTGRMNRSVDYRTDLYSLGIMFYEMLAGVLPFEADDSMEYIHAHMAKKQTSLIYKNSDIPLVLSEVIDKLLSKNAEERYQSTEGLKDDLRKCLELLQTTEEIPHFTIAESDWTHQFNIPEKLYGRERESQQLMDAFIRISSGRSELMLVAGYSGIGKTALVNEVHKPVTEKKGYFISGKYDQFQRDIPFSAIIHALKDFVAQVLTEPKAKVDRWKRIILSSVGTNGKVITEVIPSLELIIGVQPDIPELGPAETQNRFNLVFQEFIRGISREEHPLVIFIDDWQWVDAASLNLLKLLMTDVDNQYLLLIGAFRDNEVDSTHPFARTLVELKKENVHIEQIDMKPLNKEHISQLVMETLAIEKERAAELSETIFLKARGNPFFTSQFFETLYDEGLLILNRTSRNWEWDYDQIQKMEFTDNVIELMADKIKKLGEHTQKQMRLAACIGNEFDLRTLAYIDGRTQKAVLADLWEAVEEGMILPLSENYQAVDEEHAEVDFKVYFKFLHDRVHQAAYSLIEENVRQKTNLAIGRLAYRNNSDEYINEWICDLANYYNHGAALILDKEEQLELVKINLRAGLKAKRSTAYEAALRYFESGSAILNKFITWKDEYKLFFDITKNLAECYYLLTKFDEAEESFSVLLENSNEAKEKAEVLIMMSSLYSNTLKFAEALVLCKKALEHLGIEVPNNQEETQAAFGVELESIDRLREVKKLTNIADLVDAEPITDEHILYTLGALLGSWGNAYMSNDFDTVFWSASKMVALSLEHGVAPASAYGVLAHGIYLANVAGDYNEGYEFGVTALAINEKYNDMSLRSPINHLMATFLGFWKISIRKNFKHFIAALESGMVTGNYTYTGYAYGVKMRHSFIMGNPLKELVEECVHSYDVLAKIKMESMIAMMGPNHALIKCLMGETASPTTLDCDIFNEKVYLESVGAFPLFLAVLYPMKSRMYYYAGEYEKGYENVELANPHMIAVFGSIWNVFHNLNSSLNLIGLYRKDQNHEHIATIKANQTQLKIWADNCPENFLHQYVLIEAELANVETKYLEAMDLYDQAIELAQEHEFLQDEALANELTAEFYVKIGKKNIAALYMKRAHYAYGLWGAVSKVKSLEEKHGVLIGRSQLGYTIDHSQTLSTMHTQQASTSTTHLSGSLDLGTLLKATQAISSEINLASLLEKLLKILAENAGADRIYLVLQDKDEYLIQASYVMQDQKAIVLQALSLDESDDLPSGIINYALRVKKDVILHDASKDANFQQTPYVKKNQPKAVLASLIWKQGDIRAVLYLENRQTSGIFTPNRVELLSMLSSQMVISIDNALLYQNMEHVVEERTLELREKNKRITDSIMYAETIQGAILPDENDFTRFFSDYYVIYRPKDIVSGDFYWLNEVNGSAILACIDCTGHGVPGAFMSMIGNTLLDEIVIQKQHIDPAEILSLLHKNIRKALKQDRGGNTDGMDMSVCVFTKQGESCKVEFAGAKRSLWIIKDASFEEIKGDRKSIGGFQKEAERQFTAKSVVLDKGDMVYQFTDGFADQNNPDMKRFGSKRLRQLISSYGSIEMAKQEELLNNNLDVFMDGEPQRDDITLISVQI